MEKLKLSEKEKSELNDAFKSLKLSKKEKDAIKGGELHNGGSCWVCDYHCTMGISCTSNWG